MFDVRTLLAVNSRAFGIVLNPSNIMLDSAGCEVSSGRRSGTGEIVSSYYSTFVNSDWTTQTLARKTYRDGTMFVSVQAFNTRGSNLPETFFVCT